MNNPSVETSENLSNLLDLKLFQVGHDGSTGQPGGGSNLFKVPRYFSFGRQRQKNC